MLFGHILNSDKRRQVNSQDYNILVDRVLPKISVWNLAY